MPSSPPPREIRAVDRASSSGNQPSETGATDLNLDDIYYVLFRHKLKIIFCACIGILAAFVFYKSSKRVYISEAKLFIRYVTESRSLVQTEDDRSVKSPDPGGQTILNSELEIVTSLDLAGKVVDAIGPEKFLPPAHDGRDRDRAIFLFANNFSAEVPPHSSVLQLTFKHTDPALVQPVLREVIANYLKKHVEIHRSAGMVDDFLTRSTEELRARLAQTEEDLRKAKSKLGYSSIEEAKKAQGETATRLRQAIDEAETELAEKTAYVRSVGTRVIPESTLTTQKEEKLAPPENIMADYARASTRIQNLQKNEQELLMQFTPESERVKEIRDQLADAQLAKKKLEDDYPLVQLTPALPSPAANTASAANDTAIEVARIQAIRAKITSLNNQFAALHTEMARTEQMEAELVELNRRKELDESNYKKYSTSLEQARLDDAMSSGHVSNIGEIQSPSLPLKAKSKRLQNVLGLGVSGFALGVAWAFILDLFLDRSIKRPADFERKLNVPLFLSIPALSANQVKRLALASAPDAQKPGQTKEELAQIPASETAPANQALQPFHATLRDRLIQYFENQNLVHKPKLVAVTGLTRRAGVTSTAAGLAQSLSETGEGNVLLVDMTAGQGSAQHYVRGKAVSSLEDTLKAKDPALVQENLYVVTEGNKSDWLSRNLPQRFNKLVPKLKASDFDYIIFDMPPVSQISVTPRLAGFMDMVLLVVEAEKSSPESVEKATALLTQSKVRVGAVLNKTQTYLPKFLDHSSLEGI